MAVTPDEILRDMSELWVTLAKPGEETGAGVLRACSMTLLVLADEGDDATAIGETLAAVMTEHPSRAIVVRVRAGASRHMEARVLAQCWLPFGQRRQICCEQVEITAGEGALPDLPALLLPLAAPDLPVFLWCRSPRLFASAAWPALARLAGKVIVDSTGLGDAASALTLLGERARFGGVADLAWTRLTAWREPIATIFENRTYLPALARIREIRLTGAGTASQYLAAWLLDGARQAGAAPAVRLLGAAATLQRVELSAPDAEFSMTLESETCAGIVTPGGAYRTTLPATSGYRLLSEELAIPGRDPIFEKVLAGAPGLRYVVSE